MSARHGFDRLARPYRWMEYVSFGPMLQRCRVRHLGVLTNVREALVLGDGDGRFTAALLRAVPGVRVTAVDASAGMLAELLRNCGADADRVTPLQMVLPAGLDGALGGRRFDLVATHFFLDCLTTDEVVALAQHLQGILSEDAVWVVSDFAEPGGVMRLPATFVVGLLYRAFRLLTGLPTQQLPLYAEALTQIGLCRTERRTMLGGLLFSELWRFSGPQHKLETER